MTGAELLALLTQLREQVAKIGDEEADALSTLRRLQIPFSWNTITATFTEGTASSVNLSQFLVNTQNRPITYSASGTLPDGISLSNAGLLSYNGTGPAASVAVRFLANWTNRTATSALTTLTVEAVNDPGGNDPPVWSVSNPYALPVQVAGVATTVNLSLWASDPDGDEITFARTGSANDTAPSIYTVSAAGVLTIPVGAVPGSYALEVDAYEVTANWWSTVPDQTFTLGTPSTADLTVYVAAPSAVQYRLASGTLPSGVTLSEDGLLAYDGNAGATAQTISVEAYAATGTVVATATVTAAGSSPVPWTFGHAFREGDVPTGSYLSSNATTFQADVKNRWPDGSIKFAILSGTSAPGAVSIERTTTTPAGGTVSAITAADVGSTFVTIDGVNVALADAINGADLTAYSGTAGVQPPSAGRFRDWIVGPVVREAHFYAPVPARAGLGVFWYVRKYATGNVEVETIVENGWFQIAATSMTYTASVTVNGTVRPWHDSVSSRSITQGVYTRWSRVDWVGTDPTVWVTHDTAYLTSTWLVPNYGWPVSTNEAAFTTCRAANDLSARVMASVTDDEVKRPTPLANSISTVFWRPSQNEGGEEDYGQIGLLPSWEAVFLRTGDARALRTTLYSARTWQFVPTWRRDERTLRMPRTDATTVISYSNANAEREHQPSTGYLPYLLTGRYSYLETAQNTALWNFFKTATATPWPRAGLTTYNSGREGAKGILVSGELAPRAVAWPWRSLATACCITPDDDALRSDLVYCMQQNIEYFWGLQRDSTPMANNLGVVWTVSSDTFYSSSYFNTGTRVTGDPIGAVEYLTRIGNWQHGFLSSAIGFTRGMKIVTGTSATDLASLHAHSVKLPIGQMGNSYDGSGYSWRRSSTYYEPVGRCARTPFTTSPPAFNPPASFFASWRACYEFTRNYWGASDIDDSQPTSTAIFDTWSSGGAFQSGFQPGTPVTMENSNDIESIPSLIQTRAQIAPLAFGVDYAVPGASAAFDKFVNSNVYRDNATARQNLANGPRFCPTPRGRVW